MQCVLVLHSFEAGILNDYYYHIQQLQIPRRSDLRITSIDTRLCRAAMRREPEPAETHLTRSCCALYILISSLGHT